MSNQSPERLLVAIRKVIAAVHKHMAGETLVLGGITLTAEAFIAELTDVVAQLTKVVNAREALRAERKALARLMSATYKPRIGALRQYVQARFGRHSVNLVDFGVKPQPVRKRTDEPAAPTPTAPEVKR